MADMTADEVLRLSQDDERAARLFTQTRWPDHVDCPRCGALENGQAEHSTGKIYCRTCKLVFTISMNTPMEGVHPPFGKWATAGYLAVAEPLQVTPGNLASLMGMNTDDAARMATAALLACAHEDDPLRALSRASPGPGGGNEREQTGPAPEEQAPEETPPESQENGNAGRTEPRGTGKEPADILSPDG